MANIFCKDFFYSRKNVKETVKPGQSNGLVQQIKPHPTIWQYPFINYFAQNIQIVLYYQTNQTNHKQREVKTKGNNKNLR